MVICNVEDYYKNVLYFSNRTLFLNLCQFSLFACADPEGGGGADPPGI